MRKLFPLIAFAFLSVLIAAPPLAMAGGGIEVGFSRGDPSAKTVVMQAIGSAQASLQVAAYQYTEPDITAAVLDAAKRGVKVSVILDRTQRNMKPQADLVAAGAECRISQNYKIMHHKFIVIDGKSVENGSFNYTANGDKANAENALFIPDNPLLASRYADEWAKVSKASVPCSGVVLVKD